MPKVKGGKDGEKYIASFDGKSQHGRKKTESPNEKCILLISPQGNAYCTGKWFDASFHSGIKKFSHLALLLPDTPNKYNLKIDSSSYEDDSIENNYRKQASILGFNWLTENLPSFFSLLNEDQKRQINIALYPKKEASTEEKISFYYEVIDLLNQFSKENELNFFLYTWEQWVEKEETNILKLKDYALNIESIREAISNKAAAYVKKHGNLENGSKLSELYLLEETIGIVYLAIKRGYHHISYPGDIIEPIKELIEHIKAGKKLPDFLKDLPDTNLDWLHVNFKNMDTGKKPKVSDKINIDKNSSPERSESQLRLLHIIEGACNELVELGFTHEQIRQALSSFSQIFLADSAIGKNAGNTAEAKSNTQHLPFFPPKPRQSETKKFPWSQQNSHCHETFKAK